MLKVRTTVLIAMLAATAAPAFALTQGGNKEKGGNKQEIGQANFGNLISALNNIAVEVTELSALNNLTIKDVRIVNIGDVLKGNNVEAFNNALNRNNVEVVKLTNVLNNNTVLTDFLKNNNIAVSRVVAIDVLSGGVTLFVQPVPAL